MQTYPGMLVLTVSTWLVSTVTTLSAVELRFQVGSVPGYEKAELRKSDVWGDADAQTYGLDEERGFTVGVQAAFVPAEGGGLLTAYEIAYRKSGTNDMTVKEIGGAGRIGYAWAHNHGLRYEGGARIGLSRAETDHAYAQTTGNNYALTSTKAIGFGMQFGLFLGASYRLANHLIVGAEVAFESNFLEMSAGGIYHDIDGKGAAGLLYAGYLF